MQKLIFIFILSNLVACSGENTNDLADELGDKGINSTYSEMPFCKDILSEQQALSFAKKSKVFIDN